MDELRTAAAAVVTAIRHYRDEYSDGGLANAIDHLAAVLGDDDGRDGLRVVPEGHAVMDGKVWRLQHALDGYAIPNIYSLVPVDAANATTAPACS